MVVILGAGLSGLSASYHIGHNKCMIYEKKSYAGGHIYSESIDGFTWDEGPHVSFTTNEYVKELFAQSVENEFLEYPVETVNYFQGNWIPHPAQSNLYAVPQPLREESLQDFLTARQMYSKDFIPENYQEWLEYAFGKTFTDKFPAAYTRKYWTVNPEKLSVDWVGNRVFFPQIEQVKQGYFKPLQDQTHYIKHIRYPKRGGYLSYSNKIAEGANIAFNKEVDSISFKRKEIIFKDGLKIVFNKLISSIPLISLINLSDAPEKIKEEATKLNCSSVLLVNVMANHTTVRKENWIYVYDEEKFSTRINCTELLSSNNAPDGKTGVQVEVYFSNYRLKTLTDEEIAKQVVNELIEMGLIKNHSLIERVQTKWIEWANIIFDHHRIEAQNNILEWLEQQGLVREKDDLHPMTDWNTKFSEDLFMGDIILTGRFGQWKYYWTDDCVLRGKLLQNILHQ